MTTNPVYPDSIKIEYHNGATWVNISAYVVSNITFNSGLASPDANDRVATLGLMELELNNVNKLFTPYGGDSVHSIPTLTGFNKEAKIRVSVVINGFPKVVWAGRIDSIKSDDGIWGSRRVQLTCVDWMDVATRFPMKGAEIEINKTIDEAATSILSRLTIQPEGTDFDEGDETFPAIFSNVKDKTQAITELNKLALSELGFIYLLQDGTLKIENSSARRGTRQLDMVPVHPDLLDYLNLLDGDSFALLDGDSLLLDEAEEAQLEFSVEKLDIELTDDVINAFYARAYPTRTATSLEVVFSLGSPIKIAAGQTRKFTAPYANPNGGNPINAINLEAPVATTDYLMNSLKTGLGTNLTANLTVSATYYGDRVSYVLTNTGTALSWVTKLQARGFGIYYDAPIDAYIENTESIASYGDTVLELDQKYRDDFDAGLVYGKSIIEQYKLPKSRVKQTRFLANKNHAHLMACLYLDVGGLVRINDNRSELSKWYYIFSRSFLITLGGIMVVTLGLVERPSIDSEGLNPVAVELGGTGTTDAVNFGYLPRISGLDVTSRTFSAWIYQHTDAPSSPNEYVILTTFGDNKGIMLYTRANRKVFFFSDDFSSGGGRWETGTNAFSLNTLTHIVVSFVSDDIDANPVMYIDGVQQTLTKTLSLLGTYDGEEGKAFIVGNMKSAVTDYTQAFDGLLRDIRVYNRILTQAEVTEMYNAGMQDYSVVTDGLIFQAFTINSDLGDAASLDGQEIPSGHNYLDNIFLSVGEPNGTPLIRP